jgi:hypothetical protein
MSKERETLITDLSINAVDGFFYITQKLQTEIRELLAQPETELEPVAWCQLVDGKVQDLLTSFEMKDWLYDKSWIPLYTAQPNRKPLSEEEVFDIGYKSGFAVDQDESADYESDAYGFLNEDGYVDNELYFKLVRAIEKAHGIGG